MLFATASLCAALGAAEVDPLRSAIERQFREGQTAQAMQRIERAVAARPDDAGLRFLHSVLLAESGRSAEAAVALERLIQDFPEIPEPYNNLAALHAAQGRLDSSRELLEAALRADPGYLVAHRNLGDVFVRLALRAYESAAAGRTTIDDALANRLRLSRELAELRPAR